MHNETLNFWTHFLSALYFCYLWYPSLIYRARTFLYDLVNPTSSDYFVWSLFFLGALLQMGFSATYHLFCTTLIRYRALAKLDYAGITCMILGP